MSFRSLHRRAVQSTAEVWDQAARDNPLAAAAAAPNPDVEQAKTAVHVNGLLPYVSGRVLDLGCGYGRIGAALVAQRPDLDYVGVDGSTVMLDALPDHLEGVKGELAALPFPDEHFDSVFTVAVLLHNSYDEVGRAVEEARRVLKPGGTFVVIAGFPNFTTVTGLQNWLALARFRLAGKGGENGPLRPWTRGRVRRLFETWSSVEVIPSGFAPIPKGVLGLPEPWNSRYRRRVYEPTTRSLQRTLPDRARAALCAHHDVVAVK